MHQTLLCTTLGRRRQVAKLRHDTGRTTGRTTGGFGQPIFVQRATEAEPTLVGSRRLSLRNDSLGVTWKARGLAGWSQGHYSSLEHGKSEYSFCARTSVVEQDEPVRYETG